LSSVCWAPILRGAILGPPAYILCPSTPSYRPVSKPCLPERVPPLTGELDMFHGTASIPDPRLGACVDRSTPSTCCEWLSRPRTVQSVADPLTAFTAQAPVWNPVKPCLAHFLKCRSYSTLLYRISAARSGGHDPVVTASA
jgi:hypothetical protein